MRTSMAIAFLLVAAALPAQYDVDELQLAVPFVSTPPEVVDAMLDLAAVTEDDIVYDLGCGDGRIVIAAAKKHGARGVGIDNSPELVRSARNNAKAAGVDGRVKFIEQDLFEADIREATVVTIFLLPEVNLKLRPKLLEVLKPGTRIVSHAFGMGDWKPDKQVRADERNIYLWTIPE